MGCLWEGEGSTIDILKCTEGSRCAIETEVSGRKAYTEAEQHPNYCDDAHRSIILHHHSDDRASMKKTRVEKRKTRKHELHKSHAYQKKSGGARIDACGGGHRTLFTASHYMKVFTRSALFG